MKRLILIFGLLILLINITSAANGCCLDASNGLCSVNSERTSCESNGGVYYNDASCSSVNSCSLGCCVLGFGTEYITARQCDLQAKSSGIEYNFQDIDEQSCAALSNSQERGACVYEGEFENNCEFVTRSECNGDFYANQLCSNPGFNTTCVKKEETICFDNDVYFIDSCGNTDAKYLDCDYNSGTICGSYRSRIDDKPQYGNNVCRSLNCEGGKNNGDRWCVDPTGEGGVGTVSLTGEVVLNGLTGRITDDGLFLRNKIQPGLTGRAVTTAHDDEYCAAQQTENTEEELILCASAGADEEGEVVYDPYTCEVCDQSLDACGQNLCKRCRDDLGGESWPGRLNGCVSDNACGAGESVSVGSRYFSQYCLNGEIFTEPCDDFRFGYCNDEKTGGQCAYNPSLECYGANVLTEEGTDSNSQQSTTIDKSACDEEFCTIYAPGDKNELFTDLGLEMCLPKITPGQQFYPAGNAASTTSTKKEESVCSSGNYQGEAVFVTCGDGLDEGWCLLKEPEEEYGSLGIIDTCVGDWSQPSRRNYLLSGIEGNPYSSKKVTMIDCSSNSDGITACKTITKGTDGIIQGLYKGTTKEIPLNPSLIGALQQRCAALGDCDGKVNWIDVKGSTGAEASSSKSKGSESTPDGNRASLTVKLNFECVEWKAPAGGDSCAVCGTDGLACSEYRCKSLGKACNYYEPEGVDRGYCVASSDKQAPVISCTNCTNKVPPFAAVSFEIATNEVAACRFDIGNSGKSYEDLPYSFGNNYGIEHQTYLHLPGQSPLEDENISSYDIINKDGKYDVYVRCEDVAGNWNLNPFVFSFTVDPTPDSFSPVILSINPENGDAVKNNVSARRIEFELNEPAECKWSIDDKEYSVMENQFNCDTSISDDGVINGYTCDGVLNNITTNPEVDSKYYIRCYDQPWLEGNETDLYKRNKNKESYEYTLRASSILEINDLLPVGNNLVNPLDTSLQIELKTNGGGYDGEASCSFKLNNGPLVKMLETDSKEHKQPLVNQSEGTYDLYVKCEDKAGNIAEGTSQFSIEKDSSYPKITRVYSLQANMVVITNEDAICYYDVKSCNFDINNATVMSGEGIEHKTEFERSLVHYVKCQDKFGNVPESCTIKVKEVRTSE